MQVMSGHRVGTYIVSDFILSASALSSPCLDLSRKDIRELPCELPGCSKLECLYLEGNHLTSLPESLFTSCPNLRWLDLRNNKLKTLSPSFEKLRSLKTLLLEGNQLTALPPQLGKLQLSGLNLSCNPLQCPPKYVSEKGTKAVLKYLRELLINTGDENDSYDSTEQSPVPTVQRAPLPLYPAQPGCSVATAQPSVQQLKTCARPALSLPTLLMQRATLHATESPLIRKMQPPRDSPSPERSQSHQRKQRCHASKRRGRGLRAPAALGAQPWARVPPEREQEKEESHAIIERRKSQRFLEEWRDEARERQRRLRVPMNQQLSHPRASQVAPFATELGGLAAGGHSDAELRVQFMDGQRSAKAQLHNAQGSATDSLRDAREQEVGERVRRYTLELQEQRKQVGLIHSPSSELLEAERRLAEAMVRRRELEARKAREYRLTAFTGDLPLGSRS